MSAAPGVPVNALMEAGHWKRARQISLERLKASPNDAQAHAWMSKIASSFGDLDMAVREAERAVALEPRNPAYQGQYAEACALMADRSSAVKGLIYVHRMKKAIEASLAVDPGHVDTMLVQMMFSWKAPGMAGGDRQKARRVADDIQRVSAAWGYLAHAQLADFQGDVAGAEWALRKAVLADPGFYRSRVLLAKSFCELPGPCRSPREAERYALEAIALDPSAEGGYNVLAQSYVAQKRWSELDAMLARAERMVPDDLGPYFAAAQRLVESGQDFDRAERYLQHYLSQPAEGRQPTHAEARRLMGEMSQRAGRVHGSR